MVIRQWSNKLDKVARTAPLANPVVEDMGQSFDGEP
jgi:hypothetical protein